MNSNYVSNIADYPGKADIGYIDPAGTICSQYIQGAWTYGRFNALGYNAERDEIVISESLMNEIWVINHNTTTAEAAGPAGDLLYRWGNPYAYGAGRPFVNRSDRGDQELSFQHRVHWIAPGLPGGGNVLIFNNGTDWGDSSVIEVELPRDGGNYRQPGSGEKFDPAIRVWQYDEYDTPGSFFASFVSSAQRLPNGNTLINNGPAGYFFEVTTEGDKMWQYQYPAVGYPSASNSVAQGQKTNATLSAYRAWRYAPDYPGLAYLNLIPGDPLETYPNTYYVDVKPGSCRNEVNRESQGLLPVAIPGSKDLDVKTIDPSSILLEGFPAVMWSIEDVSALGKCKGRDGYPDLMLKYDSNAIGIALGSASVGDEFLLRLTGYSSGGWFLGREKIFVEK